MDKAKKTLVLGLGNPILSDDAVGIKVAQGIKERLRERETVDMREENQTFTESLTREVEKVVSDIAESIMEEQFKNDQ